MTKFVPAEYTPFPGYRETAFETVHRLLAFGPSSDIRAGTQNGINGFFVPDAMEAAYRDDLRRYAAQVHQHCCPNPSTDWECERRCHKRKTVLHNNGSGPGAGLPIKMRNLGNYCVEFDPSEWYKGPINWGFGGIYGPASGYTGTPGGARDGNGFVRAVGPVTYCFPGPSGDGGKGWVIGATPVASACAGSVAYFFMPSATADPVGTILTGGA